MEVKRYQFALDHDGKPQRQRLATDADLDAALAGDGDGKETSPSALLHQLALREQDRFQNMDYLDAVKRVLNKNVQLARLYAAETNGKIQVRNYSEGDDPSAKLDAKATAFIASGECKDYAEAARRAIHDNPALADRWNRGIAS